MNMRGKNKEENINLRPKVTSPAERIRPVTSCGRARPQVEMRLAREAFRVSPVWRCWSLIRCSWWCYSDLGHFYTVMSVAKVTHESSRREFHVGSWAEAAIIIKPVKPEPRGSGPGPAAGGDRRFARSELCRGFVSSESESFSEETIHELKHPTEFIEAWRFAKESIPLHPYVC